MSDTVWAPPAELVERANVTRLGRRLGAADYHALHRISVEEPWRFWPAVIEDLGIEFSQRWEQVLDSSRGPEWTTWFTGGTLNLARVCLHRFASDDEALVGRYEDGERESLTWNEASRQVTQLAEALVELGVEEGDRVAIYMPMCPAVAIASHACAHVGAVQVPIFSGFAAPAIASRLEDSSARVAICADWSLRRGKRIDMRATLDEAGTVQHVIEWNRETRSWPELVTRQPGTLPPREVDSEAPYLLAYTSGTTGRPKGALHVQAGFLVSIARETAYQTDVKRGERIHFATDMGWIMGPWTVVGGGAVGATIVFAEGAPDWPPDRLWRTVAGERVTSLGLSPTLVRALRPHG
ncbi:MAG TPA: AMP-binding protein, partial [Gaiellaceae bacterium]|nr:AMP-binding protein [Gaiellaceae bacterium]